MIPDAAALEAAARRHRETRELIERVRAGELEAFEGLIRLHERKLLGMAIQMGLTPEDAQDAIQEIFLRVFRYLKGFQTEKNFEVWLWRIGVNVVYDQLRRRKERSEVSWEVIVEKGGEEPVPGSGVLVQVENADLCAKLLGRLEVLTSQERMVFVLKELQDLDTAEVARAMGISSITVRRHIGEARRKLRDVVVGLGRGSAQVFSKP